MSQDACNLNEFQADGPISVTLESGGAANWLFDSVPHFDLSAADVDAVSSTDSFSDTHSNYGLLDDRYFYIHGFDEWVAQYNLHSFSSEILAFFQSCGVTDLSLAPTISDDDIIDFVKRHPVLSRDHEWQQILFFAVYTADDPDIFTPGLEDWMFLDSIGHEFGPFDSLTMQRWYHKGFFPVGAELPVKLAHWKSYVPLRLCFPDISKAFLRHSAYEEPVNARPCSVQHIDKSFSAILRKEYLPPAPVQHIDKLVSPKTQKRRAARSRRARGRDQSQ